MISYAAIMGTIRFRIRLCLLLLQPVASVATRTCVSHSVYFMKSIL